MANTQHTCKHCANEFTIFENDQEFYARISAPLPMICPQCRFQRRLAYRNERTLYPDQCDQCKKNILSLYAPSDNFIVFCADCWWKDSWDSTNYGQAINWERSLLDQYNEIRHRVPRLALVNMKSENSEYTNMTADNKNCYILFAAENNENCSYGKLVQNCRDCFDCNFTYKSELCYECVDIRNCYRCLFLQDCQDSRECGFSIGLRGCSNVWLSTNLQNKEYYIANKPVPQAEFKQHVAELIKDYSALQQTYQQWLKLNEGRLVKYGHITKSEGCTGDYLWDCKRVYDSFDITSGQDCRYCTDALNPIDSYDSSFFYYQPELIYDSLSLLQSYNVKYSTFVFYCRDIQYCDQVHNSNNLFLSSCVRGKDHLILNKSYSEEEYISLVPKLIEKMTRDGEYGHLPPMRYSLFAYNDTVAQEYFSLSKEQAQKEGLRWNAEADTPYKGSDGIIAEKLAPAIREVNDDITKQVIICSETKRAYKITVAELKFYRELGLPLPRLHPECRHRRRMALRNPRKLWQRQCHCTLTSHGHDKKCTMQFATTFQPDRSELVYCEECYHKEMY